MSDKIEKIDFKQLNKELYLPKNKPMIVEVPSMQYLMVAGEGDPKSEAYQTALSLLYALTFTIKMSKMGSKEIEGYFEYVVPPLEGLWYSQEGKLDLSHRDGWHWISMIRQPEFVTQDVLEWAIVEASKKHPELPFEKAKLARLEEGTCAQIMHIGSYQDEQQSIIKIEELIEKEGYIDVSGKDRKHHEIYLSDPRRVAPEKLKTVLRIPIEKKS